MKVRKYYQDQTTGEEYFMLRDEKKLMDYLMKTGGTEEDRIIKRQSGDVFYELMGKREMKQFKKHQTEIDLRKMFMEQSEDVVSRYNSYYFESIDYVRELKKEEARRRRMQKKMEKKIRGE